MKTLAQHYSDILGLSDSWRVVDVDLDLSAQRVRIALESAAKAHCCRECGAKCSLKDHAPERSWRHLDTMQFETILVARVPRTNCATCGVKTSDVPWAEPHGRFTLMFEAFAIRVLQAASSIEQAQLLLKLHWDSLQRIMDRAVERGLLKRNQDDIPHVGIDEKSFGRGHDYVSVLTDIEGARILEVVPGALSRPPINSGTRCPTSRNTRSRQWRWTCGWPSRTVPSATSLKPRSCMTGSTSRSI